MAITAQEAPYVAASLAAGNNPDIALHNARLALTEVSKRPNATAEWESYYQALISAGRPVDAAASIADTTSSL